MRTVRIFLSRRNLLTLLSKLDKKKRGEPTARTIVKCDVRHPVYPIAGADQVIITALEDEEYYTDRAPGPTKEMDGGQMH